MKWLNLGLIRIFEFLTLLVYSFFVLVYFGAFLLLPLDILSLIVNSTSWLGLPAIVSVPLGAAVSGYFCYLTYKLPEVYQIILSGGTELTNAGYLQIRQLEAIACRVGRQSVPSTPVSGSVG